MICVMCGEEITVESEYIISIVITEMHNGGHTESGHICALGCLIDYVAKVSAMELA